MVLMPGEIRLRHVSTPTDLLGVLQGMNIHIDPTTLQATEVTASCVQGVIMVAGYRVPMTDRRAAAAAVGCVCLRSILRVWLAVSTRLASALIMQQAVHQLQGRDEVQRVICTLHF